MTGPGAQVGPSTASAAEMANAVRVLAMDAVQQANSGHPGMPMGMADAAAALYSRILKFDPGAPDWPDRDRFVLSAGHGSMLLYALLYLTGYDDIDLGQLRAFRQLGSRTAGHPEYGNAGGIETTTGPLGQGLGNAVGMALAERLMANRFGPDIVDHFTYAIAGDGCLMEGISHEAASLAGHLGLGKLIVLFDDNRISIDGPTDIAVSDDHGARFAAYGWDVRRCDGHDADAVAKAVAAAKETPRPSLVACRTTIGFGAPNKQGTAAAHGAPLGVDEIAAAREALNWPHPPFEIPGPVLAAWRRVGGRGAAERRAWQARLAGADAGLRREFERRVAGTLPDGFEAAVEELKRRLADQRPMMATRKASQTALEAINPLVPETIGGSADLTGSNNTRTADMTPAAGPDFAGRYVHYGVREHAMAAVMNGMALHGGVIPYGGTFLVFSDYCRPAIRLSAMMGLRVVYVFTHDSIGLGEDGPTHQPVEHLSSLRAIPNLAVFRPADAVETAECWAQALAERRTPSVLVLSRQTLPALRTEHETENLCARGAYELAPATGAPRVTVIASGSEVAVAMAARDRLEERGIGARVVSMPCWELFERQDEAYRERVLRPDTLRVAVEAAGMQGWERHVGADGVAIGMQGFGASAPAAELYEHFGITAQAVVAAAEARLAAAGG